MTIERKNIHLLTDFGFKRIFGTEEHKKNLIRFLNAFLKEHTGTITDITYLPTEQLGVVEDEKRLVFDVFCSTQKDDHIIVEMQRATQEFFRKRIIAYSARTISNLLRKGDREYDYPKVISILLADFHLPDCGSVGLVEAAGIVFVMAVFFEVPEQHFLLCVFPNHGGYICFVCDI